MHARSSEFSTPTRDVEFVHKCDINHAEGDFATQVRRVSESIGLKQVVGDNSDEFQSALASVFKSLA